MRKPAVNPAAAAYFHNRHIANHNRTAPSSQTYARTTNANHQPKPTQAQLQGQLYDAIQGNQIINVRNLLDDINDINAKITNNGKTALGFAASEGKKDIVAWLLFKNASTEIADNDLCTPIYSATENKHAVVVNQLIQAKANVNFINKNGYTSSQMAVFNNDISTLKLLIGAKANLNLADKEGCTPLHLAAFNNLTDIVALLLMTTIDKNQQNNDGNTPLHLAMQEGHPKVTEQLIAAKADFTLKNKGNLTPLELLKTDINLGDSEGNTLLHHAAREGHTQAIEILLAAGADMHLRNKKGYTPIVSAAKNNQLTVVKFLLSKIDPSLKRKLVHDAISDDDSKMLDCLIKAGVDINLIDDEGKTPLLEAALKGSANSVGLLLEIGADPNIVDKKNYSALHAAAECGYLIIVECLVRKESHINLQDIDQETPLKKAIKNNHFKVVQLLLLNNANISSKEDLYALLVKVIKVDAPSLINILIKKIVEVGVTDENRFTIFMMAVEFGQLGVVKDLDKIGWMNSNTLGEIALWVACCRGHLDIVDFLIYKGINVEIYQNQLTQYQDYYPSIIEASNQPFVDFSLALKKSAIRVMLPYLTLCEEQKVKSWGLWNSNNSAAKNFLDKLRQDFLTIENNPASIPNDVVDFVKNCINEMKNKKSPGIQHLENGLERINYLLRTADAFMAAAEQARERHTITAGKKR